MEKPFTPVGSALPPRRDMIVSAADASGAVRLADPVVMTRPQDRALDYFEREQLPSGVRENMASAWSGDLSVQSLMFNAMLDTWPRLQAAIGEICQRVWKSEWEMKPFCRRGEEPDKKAQDLASFVEGALWGMKPDMKRMNCGLEQTIKAIVMGYYYAHYCGEIGWGKDAEGWKPTHTKTLPARFYAYTYGYGDFEDMLMLDPTGSASVSGLQPFPDDRFLVAVNSGHAGHPITGAPLRALSGYWLASSYGLKWFMQYTQLFGVPWRHAKLADEADRPKVDALLANIGACGYIVTKQGVEIDLIDAMKGSSALPQKDLIDLADTQCDKFILGQTLTSGVGKEGGSRALGEVHEDTLLSNVEAIADFVGQVITHQLIPAIVRWNYGDKRTDLPEFWVKRDKPKNEQGMAERDKVLREAFPELEWSKAFVHDRHGIPVPADGDEILVASPNGETGDVPEPGQKVPKMPGNPDDDNDPTAVPEKKKVAAADVGITWRKFPATAEPETVDRLANAVLEDLTGVTREWLSPVRPAFERLAALAMSKHVTDEDFLAALEKAQREMPELFDKLNSETLQTAFEDAIGSAMLAGSVKRYE